MIGDCWTSEMECATAASRNCVETGLTPDHTAAVNCWTMASETSRHGWDAKSAQALRVSRKDRTCLENESPLP